MNDPFSDLLEKMQQIHNQKGHDYADPTDPYSNCRASEAWGIPAWKAALIRISDKFARVTNYAKKEKLEVTDETFEDTLLDLANYCLICIILHKEDISS